MSLKRLGRCSSVETWVCGDDSDEADEYEDAVEDSTSVDLEAGSMGGSANSCPAGFLKTPVWETHSSIIPL